ncbi:MAG: hypothetical protein ACK4M7_08175, partial [Burkholderiales bacterium]
MLSSNDQLIFDELLCTIENNEISVAAFTTQDISSSMGSKEAKALADALKVNHSVTSLDISGNSLVESNLIIILESLRKHPSLIELCINYNPLTDEVVSALLHIMRDIPPLTKLDISDASITVEKATKIFNANIPIKELNLYGMYFDYDDLDIRLLAKSLKENCHLKNLYFTSLIGISKEDYQILMDAFKANTVLEKLHFESTFYGYTIDYIEKIELLSEFIKDNKTLKEIDLSEDEFNNEGAKFLADALQNNQTLTSIGFPYLSTEGGKLLLKALNKNTSLISVNIPSDSNSNSPEFVSKITAIARGNKQ